MTDARRDHLLALAAFAVLTLLALGPIHPTQQVWGGATDDLFEHVQLLWWQADQAAQGHLFPLFTRDLAYPDGGKMFLPDPIGGTLAIPFVWLAGTTLAYNLLVWANLVFACWAMFWLVRRRSGDAWAALFAGILYGLSPVLLGNLHNGITETMQAGWLPLFAGALLTLLDRAREPFDRRRLLTAIFLTGLSWWAVALGQWYYGIYACLLFGLLVPVKARLHLSSWLAAAGALLVFAALIFPIAFIFYRSFGGGGSLFYLGSMDYYLQQTPLLLAHSADVAHLFSARPPFEHYLHLGFVGFVTPALLLWGVVRKRWAVVGWLAAGLFFIILALGPKLGWNGELVTIGGAQILLPYYLLYKIVPFFKEMRLPYRFFVMVHLCLAMGVGMGLAGWRADRRWRGLVYVALVALFGLETALLSGAFVPAARQSTAVPPLVAMLTEQPDEFAVFDLPFSFAPQARGMYLVGQTVHHRPLVYGIQGRDFSPTLADSLTANLLYIASWEHTSVSRGHFNQFRGMHFQSARDLLPCLLGRPGCEFHGESMLRDDLRKLHEMKITRFVLYRNLLTAESDLPKLCRALFGAPEVEDGRTALFVLDESDWAAESTPAE